MTSPPDVASRLRHDPVFRDLAQRDPRAALNSVGIAVPAGVTVDFLDNAFRAVDRLLDAPQARAGAHELDDALLEGVAGGTGTSPPSPGDLQAFLARIAAALKSTDPTSGR